MNILILGSGGREHAFAWKIKQSPLCEKLYVAPGNAGTSQLAENTLLNLNDFDAIADFVKSNNIGMVVVGPEEPLVNGIYDYFAESDELKNIPLIGPSKQGAMLEGSKSFAKGFMQKHQVPTATHGSFTLDTLEDGFDFIDEQNTPIVLKADGLAAGKGVLICHEHGEAKSTLREILEENKFGKAGNTVVIEQFLSGMEFSVFVLTDGQHYKTLPNAKDYKRIGEGDTGLNTGGMGCVSPVPFVDDALMRKVANRVIIPTVKGLRQDGIVYKGFLYIGLMNVDGNPYVIEYNCRMGDPETEVVLPRLKSDLVKHMLAISQGTLMSETIEADDRAAATVVLASAGYPENYAKGKEISGLDASQEGDTIIFQAGTRAENGKILTNGGRVLAVTSFGNDIHEAVEKSNTAAEKINFEGKYYRKDIGYEFVRVNN